MLRDEIMRQRCNIDLDSAKQLRYPHHAMIHLIPVCLYTATHIDVVSNDLFTTATNLVRVRSPLIHKIREH